MDAVTGDRVVIEYNRETLEYGSLLTPDEYAKVYAYLIAKHGQDTTVK